MGGWRAPDLSLFLFQITRLLGHALYPFRPRMPCTETWPCYSRFMDSNPLHLINQNFLFGQTAQGIYSPCRGRPRASLIGEGLVEFWGSFGKLHQQWKSMEVSDWHSNEASWHESSMGSHVLIIGHWVQDDGIYTNYLNFNSIKRGIGPDDARACVMSP